jgi:hypothetical protein
MIIRNLASKANIPSILQLRPAWASVLDDH